MGYAIVESAIEALNESGIRAEHACPGKTFCTIAEPVAAVSLRSAQLRSQTVTVGVCILSPAAMGAGECEKAALLAGETLTQYGSSCTVGACEFDNRLGLFMTEITAQFLTAAPVIELGDIRLGHVEAFTSWRGTDEEAGILEMRDAKWCFRLEEFFPAGTLEEDEPSEPFVLTYIDENGSKTFLQSRWTYQRRIWGPTGIRQIRLGTAADLDYG